MQLNNLKHLRSNRKRLRNNLTPAEASLWKLLQGKQLSTNLLLFAAKK
jgi:very-short-patch-repair endonuclease